MSVAVTERTIIETNAKAKNYGLSTWYWTNRDIRRVIKRNRPTRDADTDTIAMMVILNQKTTSSAIKNEEWFARNKPFWRKELKNRLERYRVMICTNSSSSDLRRSRFNLNSRCFEHYHNCIHLLCLGFKYNVKTQLRQKWRSIWASMLTASGSAIQP